MKVIPTSFEGLFLIEPNIFNDARGSFYESYSKIELEKFGIKTDFIQDNQSVSKKNVLRGLHFQRPPYAQAKLIRVVKGSILDVVVDIREKSKTFGKYYSCMLSEINNQMLFIPEGFAHGFLALEDNTIFLYKCSNTYHKDSEDGILWNDPDLNIEWGIENPILSDKDVVFNTLKSSKLYF